MAETAHKIRFIDNQAVRGREDHYATVTVETGRVIESWRASLFAWEWMLPDGRIKPREDLPPGEQARRAEIERRLNAGEAVEQPILGIGLLESVEIGVGRATFLTLAAHGVSRIQVHVPKTHVDGFAAYLS